MTNCIRCHHNLIDREGRCKQEIRQGPFSNRFKFCGCKCVFPDEAPPSSLRSYTLAELNAAAEQFVDANDASSDLNAPDAIKLRIFLGMFLQQLGKKEREMNVDQKD